MSGGAPQLFDPEVPPVTGAHGDDRSDGGADVRSIGGLYDEVEAALAQAFPRRRQIWVRGEIHHISDHRSGHLYVDLVDPGDDSARTGPRPRTGAPILHVKCWRTSWIPLRHDLAKEGISLAEGMVVVLRGSLDLYRAKGELSLILSDIDVTALLGRLAADRARLLRTLEAEGLLHRNASLKVPDVTMHIGLVASPGTEGYRDFLGQLVDSGFGFRVSVAPVIVQGPGASAAIARGVRSLGRSSCDVIALVRGGGARADLAPFETELVARAVAQSMKPIFTGIGHTGDKTVADIVAASACITPTECGHQIVVRTRQWWQTHVAEPTARLTRRASTCVADAERRDNHARRRLAAAARHQLRLHRGRLSSRLASVARRAPGRVEEREVALQARVGRLGPLSLRHCGLREEQVRSWRRLLAAYDVDRQLERGYSLTLTADGELVRSVADVAVDQEIVTRLARGSLSSRVERTEMSDADDDPGGGQ